MNLLLALAISLGLSMFQTETWFDYEASVIEERVGIPLPPAKVEYVDLHSEADGVTICIGTVKGETIVYDDCTIRLRPRYKDPVWMRFVIDHEIGHLYLVTILDEQSEQLADEFAWCFGSSKVSDDVVPMCEELKTKLQGRK